MKATKNEMVFIEFTKREIEELIEAAVKQKHPHLFTDTKWKWEDLSLAADFSNIDETEVGAQLTFSKRAEPLTNPDDSRSYAGCPSCQ